MKVGMRWLGLACAWFAAAPGAQAQLVARDLGGSAAPEAFYSPGNDITYLTNVGPGMSWEEASVYVTKINVFGIGGWRLPTTDILATGPAHNDFSSSLALGSGNELATFFNIVQPGQLAQVRNLADGYWLGNPWGRPNGNGVATYFHYAPDAGPNLPGGFVGADEHDIRFSVFAVKSGDVVAMPTPVPEPQTYALMLAGLVALGFLRARRSPPRAEPATAR